MTTTDPTPTPVPHVHECACNRNWGGPCGPCVCELLDLDAVRARHAAYRESHDHPAAFACCTAHPSADDVPALATEVERMRAGEAMYLATITDLAGKRDAAMAEAHRLRRELDELRRVGSPEWRDEQDACADEMRAEDELAAS